MKEKDGVILKDMLGDEESSNGLIVGNDQPRRGSLFAMILGDKIRFIQIEGIEIPLERLSNVNVKKDKAGNLRGYSFDVKNSQRDSMLIRLSFLTREPISKKDKKEIRQTFEYLKKYLKDITYTITDGKAVQSEITIREKWAKNEDIARKVAEHLRKPHTERAILLSSWAQTESWESTITSLNGEPLPLLEDEPVKIIDEAPATIEIKTEGGDLLTGSLHRQPRNYLQTTAKIVGRTTDEPTLFSIPEVKAEGGGPIREVISRNTAILGNYLFKLWQQRGGGDLVIDNLSTLSDEMNNTNFEIKIYLLYLGGYNYPIIDKDPSGGLTLTTEQLFKIEFKYSKKVADKYKAGTHIIIGNNLAKFIKDEPVDKVIIKPNALFIKAMEGKGLGNVLVNDKFIKLALDLTTDIAFKILSFSAGNRPKKKISEDNLIKSLGLEKQLKTQGRPRIRATILKGLQELQDKGHIKSYSYDGKTGMYEYTYSNKFIKHSDLKEVK